MYIDDATLAICIIGILLSIHSGMMVYMSMSKFPSDPWEYIVISFGWLWWMYLLIRW